MYEPGSTLHFAKQNPYLKPQTIPPLNSAETPPPYPSTPAAGAPPPPLALSAPLHRNPYIPPAPPETPSRAFQVQEPITPPSSSNSLSIWEGLNISWIKHTKPDLLQNLPAMSIKLLLKVIFYFYLKSACCIHLISFVAIWIFIFFWSDKYKMAKSDRSVAKGAKAARLQRNKMVHLFFKNID